MSLSSLGNSTIYSTWCIMIRLVILILFLLHFNPYIPFLNFSFTCILSFLLLLVFTLDKEHLNTYHHNILLGLVSKGLMKQLYFPGAKPIHCSTVCASTSTCTNIHLHSWLGLMTSEPKLLTKKSSQGENLFPCISSCMLIL